MQQTQTQQNYTTYTTDLTHSSQDQETADDNKRKRDNEAPESDQESSKEDQNQPTAKKRKMSPTVTKGGDNK